MNAGRATPGPGGRLVIALIAAYRRWISPRFGAHCRWHPSCSAYTAEAVQVHGAGRGLLLGLRRLARCHPWSAGGVDHVPGRRAA